MFRSAYFKLTLWYLTLVMGISVTFSIILYHVAKSELYNGLHRETQRIYTQFPIFNNNPMLRPDADDQQGAHRILVRIIVFNIVVLVCAGIASYLLARRTLQPIEDAHEQQKRFTADVSHELRTPLTALKMESEVTLLNPQANKDELRGALESNLEEVGKLETLINNLLRLSQLEADELKQNFVNTDIKDVVNEAISGIHKSASDHGVEIETNINSYQVFGDFDSLIQLLIILFENAVKYSKKGTKIQIRTLKKGDKVFVVVKDQGIGIAPENLQKVFDRFYRAENSRSKSNAGGFGLGLSIAKMIADLHGGDIIIRSTQNIGTTAELVLPVKREKQGSTD